MKKIFTLLSIVTSGLFAQAQGDFILSGHVEDSLGNPIPGHMVYIWCDSLTPGPSGYFYYSSTVYTDSNGDYRDTIANGTEPGYNYDLHVYTGSCNGFNYYTGMVSTSNGTVSSGVYDFMIDCTSPPTTNCSVSFWAWQDTANFLTNDTVYLLLSANSSTPSSTTIFWDFDDGNTSTSWYPSHTYANPGSYYVCVSIFDASDSCTATYCDSVHDLTRSGMILQVSPDNANGIEESPVQLQNSVYPNPFSNLVNIELYSGINTNIQLNMFDATGRNCFTRKQNLANGSNAVNLQLNDLEKGIYLLNITDENGRVIASERLIKY